MISYWLRHSLDRLTHSTSPTFRRRDWIIVAAVVLSAFVIVLIVGLVVGLTTRTGNKEVEKAGTNAEPTATPQPTAYPLPTPGPNTGLGPYDEGVVAADAGVCSEIGRNVLKKDGNAVDAAIATTFCIGVINMHSAGIGGGGFMLIYNKATKSAEVLDYREMAPAGATTDMFLDESSKVGRDFSVIEYSQLSLRRTANLFPPNFTCPSVNSL